ncbi:hypothetical protein EBZ39_03625 [bacterium]|nr:hypothetical protein [bacterium]
MEYGELVPRVMTADAYSKNKQRGNIEVLGYGGNGRVVEVYYDSLPYKYRAAVVAEYGNLEAVLRANPIMKLIKPDVKARQFYAGYCLNHDLCDSGDVRRATPHADLSRGFAPRYLPIEEQERLVRQAEWLNMILTVMRSKKAVKDVLGMVMEAFWQQCVQLAKTDKPVNPGLPENLRALKRKVQEYKDKGYECLVSKKYGNQNTRKVDVRLENLICSLAVIPAYVPTATEVCRMFKEFMNGRRRVVNLETGEVLDPAAYKVNGKVVVPADSTIEGYMNKPINRMLIDKGRASQLQWRDMYAPHVVRKSPEYAFSKITMDDRDLPFQDIAGERSVKCYMVIDVASGCYVGKAYGRDKGVELIREALRDMAGLIMRKGWGFPYEIEFERHLTDHLMGKVASADGGTPRNDGTDEFMPDVLTEGLLFTKLRKCLGGNPQEKRAEHFIKRKKHGFESKIPGYLGRFYAKSLTTRLNADKAKVRYMYEQIVQHDLDTIDEWNNSLHPNQQLYPNMTRWEVLEQRQNPNTVKHPAETVVRYLGVKTQCGLKREFLNVQGSKYALDDVWSVARIDKWDFECYYMMEDDGIKTLYLYAGNKYVTTATRVEPFQESAAEQTAADKASFEKQMKYINQFKAMVKERKAGYEKVGVMVNEVASLVATLPPRNDGSDGDLRRATPYADEGANIAPLREAGDVDEVWHTEPEVVPVKRTFEQRVLDSI